MKESYRGQRRRINYMRDKRQRKVGGCRMEESGQQEQWAERCTFTEIH